MAQPNLKHQPVKHFHVVESALPFGATIYYVASTNADPAEIRAGEASPIAVCTNALSATLIANALNEYLN